MEKHFHFDEELKRKTRKRTPKVFGMMFIKKTSSFFSILVLFFTFQGLTLVFSSFLDCFLHCYYFKLLASLFLVFPLIFLV